ncbi:MAG: PglZ domain-containing protein [Fimbriimonadales bacterium]|nr:MAG: PglZ domain-containing protein [Fimbriimonadales bacterium]
MSKLREYLARTLKKKVDGHGIVVWVDDHREYGAEVARSLCPSDALFAAWDGSWYALRREIEPLITSAEPPRLVIYQPTKTPKEDPLAEVRDAGTEWKVRLATLLKDALKGELSPARLDEIARQARTLDEAEAALPAGEIVEVPLQAALRASEPIELALRILADSTDGVLDADNRWDDARRFLQRAFGGEPRGTGDALRNAVFRHLVLVELEEALGPLPENLGLGPGLADREQRRRARELLARWRRDLDRLSTYRDLAVRAEGDLGLNGALEWDDRVADLDTVPLLEELALGRAVALLQRGDFQAAGELARKRKQSLWVRASVPEAREWQPRWHAVESLIRLASNLSANPVPRNVSAGEILRWYATSGWLVDQAHRHCEAALSDLRDYGHLDGPIVEVRRAYERWLEALLDRFAEAMEQGLDSGLPRQSEVHKTYVAPGEGVTAYIWVDALRYELGHELAEALRGTHSEVEISVAVATPPTITPVGMASLLPRAERGLGLSLSSKGEVEVFVDGLPVRTVQDRVNLVRAAHGQVVDFVLTELFDKSENALRKQIGSARLVIVRSQEIDEAFESDHTAAAWRYVKEIRELLVRATARLAAAGVERFVIASDHGFLILSRPLGPERTIEPLGGEGELHRRCWVGRGGTTSPSVMRFALADFEVAGDLDLVVPRGLAMFGVAGARRFLHGGLSPQELVVPVIVVRAHLAAPAAGGKVTVRVAGDRITTGVFSASVQFEADLFTTERHVRVSARDGRGREVAKVVAGEGYDDQNGFIRLRGAKPQVLTFRLTESLTKGDRVTLHVYESDTDRLLAKARPAEVVTDVGVD